MKSAIIRYLKKKWHIILYFAFLFIVILNLFISHFYDSGTKFKIYDTTEFENDWYYEFGDGIAGYTSLPNSLEKSSSRYLTMTNTIPSIENDTSFIFRARHTFVRIKIDDLVVYDEITREERKNNWYTLQGINYICIELSPQDSGKTITIESYTSESRYLSGPGEAVIIDRGSFILKLVKDKFMAVVCIMLLSVTGLLLLVFWFISEVILKHKNRELICLGLFSMSVALWLTTESQLAQFFFKGTRGLTTLAYETLILIPVPIALYFTYASDRKITIRMSNIAASMPVVWFIIYNGMHIFKICTMPNSLIVTQILLGIEALFVGYVQVTEFKYKRDSAQEDERKIRSLPFCGVAILVPLALVEVTKYALSPIMNQKTDGLLISFGILFYICMLSIESVVKITYKAAKLQQNTDTKSQFLANMSHEIRTPLNAIMGFNEAILQNDDVEKIHDYSQKIQRSGDTLKGIINSILDISKIEAGKLEICSMEYSMLQLLDNTASMMETLAKQKGLDFKVDIDSTIPEVLIGDEQHLRQILINIINNAIKYTHEGRVTLTVKLLEKSQSSPMCKILFSVKDTGVGIKEEDQQKLFEKFERLNADKNSNAEGTGLGMSIVLQTLQAMNSQIKLKSEYGVGSEFYFELDQCVVTDGNIGDFHARRKEVAIEGMKSTKFTAPDANILIVDDVQMNLDATCALLEFTKMQIDTVLSGKEAIEAVKNKHYDIIFMDHMMPGMDGIEATQIIRNLAVETNDMYYASVPIIALTANVMVGMKEMFQQSGMMDFVSKPIELPVMVTALKKWLPKEYIKLNKNEEANEDTGNEASKDDEEKQWSITIADIDMDTARQYNADFKGFERNINSFYKSYKATRNEISGYADADDIHNYTIKVHGLKSTSRMIGATALSEKARELEERGNAGELSSEETKILFELYDSVICSIGNYLGIGNEDATSETDASDCISEEAYQELMERIKKAAADFDAMELMTLDEELTNVKVPSERKEEFDKLSVMVSNMAFGEINEFYND